MQLLFQVGQLGLELLLQGFVIAVACLQLLLLLAIGQEQLLQLLLHLVKLQQGEFGVFAGVVQFAGAGVQLLFQVGQLGLELPLQSLLGLRSGRLHLSLAVGQRREQLRQRIGLRNGLLQALAVLQFRLAAQQLRLQFEVVVGIQQLRLDVEQAQNHAGHQRADRVGVLHRTAGSVARQPVPQAVAAQALEPPTRQQKLAAGLPAVQQLAIALVQGCAAERCLRCCRGRDQPIGAVIDQQAGVVLWAALIARPGFQACCHQLRDHCGGQWQR